MPSFHFLTSDAYRLKHVKWCTVALLVAGMPFASHAQTPIRISIQPGLYQMLPVHVASANGYWKMAGLSPSFVSYRAGLPQVKGHTDWDVGITGAVPALIGARDFNLVTVASWTPSAIAAASPLRTAVRLLRFRTWTTKTGPSVTPWICASKSSRR